MPIDVHIDGERNLVRRRVSGEVSTDDMIASFNETLRHPEYRPGMNELTDVREHVHQTTGEDIRKVADSVKERASFTGNVKLAIVVSRTVSYGLSRMLQMLMDDTPWEVAIFEDTEEAESWLEVT